MEAVSDQNVSDAHDENDCLENFVLQNPVILSLVLSCLDTKSLRKARRVNKFWENEASGILGKRAMLSLSVTKKGLRKDKKRPTIKNLATLNPKLLKRIKIKSCRSLLFKSSNITLKWMTAFGRMWQDVVEELVVEVDVFSCLLNAFHKSFSNVLPKLKTVSVIMKEGTGPEYCWSPLGISLAATHLKIDGNFGFGLWDWDYQFLQHLMDCMPNLKVLEIDGHLYPSLSGSCGNLKELILSGGALEQTYTTLRAFDANEVFRMLSEVGDHLEHFKMKLIVCANPSAYPRVKDKFSNGLPRLAKLRSISLRTSYLFPIGGDGFSPIAEHISMANCPNLTSVSLDKLDYLQSAFFIHTGVRSLKLSDVDTPDMLTRATQMFPRVNQITNYSFGLEKGFVRYPPQYLVSVSDQTRNNRRL